MIRRIAAVIAGTVSLGLGVYVGLLVTAMYLNRYGIRRHHVESVWFWLAASLLVFAMLTVRRGDDPRSPTATLTQTKSLFAIGMVSAWLVYFRSLGLGCLSDDFVLLERARNGDIWSLGPGGHFFRPLPLMFWHLLSNVSANPWVLHFVNISLHGLLAGLTGLLALRWGWGYWWAAMAALWLAVQPSAVEAVAWASGIQDVLMAVCVVSALVVAESGLAARRLFVVMLLVAAVLSKEAAVAAPALLAIGWICRRHGVRARDWLDVLVAVAVVGAYAVARLITMTAPPDNYMRVLSRYFLKELIVQPFANLAVPWHGHTIARFPVVAIACALVPLILLLVAVARTRTSALLRALQLVAWVLISVGPVYGYLFISADLEGSRYLYLATPAWVLLLVGLFRSAAVGRLSGPAIGAATAMVLLSAVGVILNLRPWIAAAEVRDVVVREAWTASAGHDCLAFAFEGVPDSVDGAYVFRNGFDRVVGELRRDSTGSVCRFAWDGDRFVRKDGDRAPE